MWTVILFSVIKFYNRVIKNYCWVFFPCACGVVLFSFGFVFFGVFRIFCLDFFFNDCSSDSRICPVAEMGKIHVFYIFYNKEEVSKRKHKE